MRHFQLATRPLQDWLLCFILFCPSWLLAGIGPDVSGPTLRPEATSRDFSSGEGTQKNPWNLWLGAGVTSARGELRQQTKDAVNYVLGLGRDAWSDSESLVRANLMFWHTSLPPRNRDLSGKLTISAYDLRADYLWTTTTLRPYIGAALGAYHWHGTITERASDLKNHQDRTDFGGAVFLGFDYLPQSRVAVSPELGLHWIGGYFTDSLLTPALAVRWAL